MARKKNELEDIIEEKEDIKVEKKAKEEKLTIDDATSLYDKNIEIKKEITNIINRIAYVKNEIKKEQALYNSIDNIKFTRELKDVEVEKLTTVGLTIKEFERQLEVNNKKIEDLTKEVEENIEKIDKVALEYSKEILKDKAVIYNKKQSLIKEAIDFANKFIQSDSELLEQEKETIERVSKVIRLTRNIPNFSQDDVFATMNENGIENLGIAEVNRKEILNNLRKITIYSKRKGL